jgi:hypothetical protein
MKRAWALSLILLLFGVTFLFSTLDLQSSYIPSYFNREGHTSTLEWAIGWANQFNLMFWMLGILCLVALIQTSFTIAILFHVKSITSIISGKVQK